MILKTLVLTRFRPDRPAGGAALRNWQNIRGLARLGSVDVLSIGAEDASEPIEGVRHWQPFSHAKLLQRRTWVRKLRAKLWRLQPGVHPSLASYVHDDVVAWLRQHASNERYHVAVIEELSLARYRGVLAEAGCRIVYDAHNVETALRAEIAADAKSAPSILTRRLHAEEQTIISGSDLVWTCSEYDTTSIRKTFADAAPLVVVPNGVDVEGYQAKIAAASPDAWRQAPLTMVYPASFSYKPNTDAALKLIEEVLPAIRSRGYDPRVILVGRDPQPAMRAAAAKDSRIEITGAVESIMPYLSAPCVIALPITLGSGTRLKILEAFATGRPVVSTSKGCEGIDAQDGKELLIRDNMEAMAEAVIDVWHNENLRARLCANALALVRSHYSWDVAAIRIRESIESLKI